MPLIDFKEIPQANTGKGDQDTFELFARDFLREIGFNVIEEPARGADGGKDLIVLERRTGILGETEVRRFVSCKHFAHNQKGKKGKSVSTDDEQNILDRVKSKNCDGFIGFYSTLPSSGLDNNLRGLSSKISYHVFDWAKIEKYIVGYYNREQLFLRYFPESYKKWKELHYYTEPVKLFNAYFENKYQKKDKELINQLFGKVENLIKPLKDNKKITEIFLEYNKSIHVTGLFYFIQPIIYYLINQSVFSEKNINIILPKMISDVDISSIKIQEMSDNSANQLFHFSLGNEGILSIKTLVKTINERVDLNNLEIGQIISISSMLLLELFRRAYFDKEQREFNESLFSNFLADAEYSGLDFFHFRSYLLHKNELLVTKEFFDYFEQMFEDLKSMLK